MTRSRLTTLLQGILRLRVDWRVALIRRGADRRRMPCGVRNLPQLLSALPKPAIFGLYQMRGDVVAAYDAPTGHPAAVRRLARGADKAWRTTDILAGAKKSMRERRLPHELWQDLARSPPR